AVHSRLSCPHRTGSDVENAPGRRPPAHMRGPGFVHLHTHSEYSLLDGAARVEAPRSNPSAPTIFSEAARDGMSAIAVTDHGAMFGALRFYEAARKEGVKPIIGVEAYVAPGSRFDRTPGESEEKYYHLTLLAENETGYRNLLRLVSLAHLEGFYHRPRMDKQLLTEHADGLICLSGCLSSEVGVLLVNGHHDRALAAAAETRRVFSELPDACDQTLVIAERVQLLPELERIVVEHRTEYRLPRFETPHGEALESYLRELVERGVEQRYGTPPPVEVLERIDTELAVIAKMGFAGYFLIVWDLIRFARERGIRVGPGRGSAAGSVASYALRITDLDPLRYGLLFERFLNPDRLEMPDIDMDFAHRRRDQVIRYPTATHGSDRVAQIVTFQTIKGKQGIRD